MTTDFGRRLKLARKHAGLTQKELAPMAGMSQSNLSELETVAHESGKTAQLAAACGVDAHWLATGDGMMVRGPGLVLVEPYGNWMQTHQPSGGIHMGARGMSLAHELSEARPSNVPVLFDWSQILKSPLPARFMLELLDDAMAVSDPPSMRPGDFAMFAPASVASPGDVVLIADMDDNVYVRRFQQRTPGRWIAVARNDAYVALDSERDGLRILAVQIGGLWA